MQNYHAPSSDDMMTSRRREPAGAALVSGASWGSSGARSRLLHRRLQRVVGEHGLGTGVLELVAQLV